MKKFFIALICLFIFNLSYAQDENFETTVPDHWSASLGTLSISDDHYKLGDKSLQWDWVANDTIVVDSLHHHGLVDEEVWDYFKNRFHIWIYNTAAVADEELVIEFYDNTNTLQFYYTFQIGFTGWRAGALSYRFDMFGDKGSTNLTSMRIKAPSTGSGTFFFDYIDYTANRQPLRKPDYQLPFIVTDGLEHWQDELYFMSLPKTVNLETATAQELSDLSDLKLIYDNLIDGNAPTANELNVAISDYNTLNISYINGISKGNPLFGADYPSSQNIEAVNDFIHTFAKSYHHDNNNTASLTYFINTVRYLLDQGYAEGSIMETTHHIGYDFRNVSQAIHLMKAELEAEGLWEQAKKMVEWYLTLNIIWHPTALNANMDEANTNLLGQLGAILYKSNDDERVQYMKGLKLYLETWLTPLSQEGEGIKVDYTGFHHNTYYPGYSFLAFRKISEVTNYLSNTEYAISSDAFQNLKKILLVARITMSDDQVPNSLTGRHPFTKPTIMDAFRNGGLASPVDTDLLRIYNKITGGDSSTDSHGEESSPNGFWQINFANLGVYRQGDWVANIKGFNNYFWGAEIYSADGRYSRYQSYGAIEIMPEGGLGASAFNINGWNWNMPPGSTTIHLPWTDLRAASNRQDEATDSRFAASLRFGNYGGYIDEKLEGTYGVFGMDFQQKEISNTHDDSFTFKKSVFCMDGKLICLGSGISHDDTNYVTATNLFQNSLTNTATPIIINNTSTATFPYSTTLSNSSSHWLLDAVDTGYYIADGQEVEVSRQNQISPNENGNNTNTSGDFATAYIRHGITPANATYEYVIIPETTASDMTTFNNDMSNPNTAFYTVLQQDLTAHIIQQNNSDIYAYSLFAAGTYTGSPLLSNDQPCLVMLKDQGAGGIALSLVNPDLNFANNGGVSQGTTITLEIEGDRTLVSSNGGTVTASSDGAKTTVTISAKDGLPVDMMLSMVTLPVELVAFTGICQKDKQQTLLEWTTASEQNHQTFILERSNDTEAWKAIMTIQGTGDSAEEKNYLFVDEEPVVEPTYYRLVDVSTDGHFNYSAIIEVNCPRENYNFTITPNPAHLRTRINIQSSAFTLDNEIILMDALGQVVQQTAIGNSRDHMLSLDGLPSGVYYIYIKNGDSGEILSDKLIIQY